MEIICDYCDKGYIVLSNDGDLTNTDDNRLIEFIKVLLKSDNAKVMVAVDNVHSERTACILYVMDQLSRFEKYGNVEFRVNWKETRM